MRYFANAFTAAAMASAFFWLGLWTRDMNRLPFCRERAILAWLGSSAWLAICAAWIVNAKHGGQTPFGRFVQNWSWGGVACGAGMVLWTVALSYRRSALDRAEKRHIQTLVER